MSCRLAAALAFALSFGTPALAETVVPSGTLPMNRMTFRHVTPLGATKPDGAVLDARAGTRPDLDRKSRELGRLIATAICRGC